MDKISKERTEVDLSLQSLSLQFKDFGSSHVAGMPALGKNLADESKPTQQEGSFSWPHSDAIERALLGTLLINNSAFERVRESLRGFHFADAVHGKIYDAIFRLISDGRTADCQTLRHHLALGTLFHGDEERGHGYLLELAGEALLTANVSHYSEVIEDLYNRRALIVLAHDMAHAAQSGALDKPSLAIAESVEKRLYDLSESEERRLFQPFHHVLARTVQQVDSFSNHQLRGLSTHLKDLNHKLGGLQRSDLIVLAARPSMGKSALAMNIAWHLTSQQLKNGESAQRPVVAFFSLEMSAEQLALRLLAEESGFSADDMRKGKLKKKRPARGL